MADRDGLGDGGELPRPRAAARQGRVAERGPCPGYRIDVLDADGGRVPAGEQGAIAVRLPLPPGTLATLWNDDERCVASYLARYPGWYLTGDGGHIDEDGYLFVMGRIDDVINVAGHRLSTGAMEEVVATHPDVAECAVFGVPDELRGEVPLGLVVLKAGAERDADELRDELVALVRERVGPVACFRDARVVARLPKTRSGKILRSTMRDIAAGRDYVAPGHDRRPGDHRRDRRDARPGSVSADGARFTPLYSGYAGTRARNARSARSAASGCSSSTMCAAPGITTSSASGRSCARRCAAAAGVVRSSSPDSTSTGLPAAAQPLPVVHEAVRAAGGEVPQHLRAEHDLAGILLHRPHELALGLRGVEGQLVAPQLLGLRGRLHRAPPRPRSA